MKELEERSKQMLDKTQKATRQTVSKTVRRSDKLKMIRIIDTLFMKKGHKSNEQLYNVEDEDDDLLDEYMHFKNIYDKTFGITAKDAVFKK